MYKKGHNSGEILQKEFLEPMGLSRNALAKAIGVTPARIK